MAILKCKMCGGDLMAEAGSNVCECEYCGSKQTVPTADNEKKMTLFARANRLRFNCEFDKAASIYETIVGEFPEEPECYWGLVLCKYGIEYVDDPNTGKKIPTCHRSSFDSVMDDANFDLVMEYSELTAKHVYRDEAKQIEELRKRILEVASKEEPYDIFICYKETAEDGQRTLDSVLAQDVYDCLTEKGYRVFFSRVTLEDKLGQEYEPYIFAALNGAKVMLAIGTSYDYYNAVWVKNEWSRYLKLMETDKTKTLIPCFKDLDPYDMPKEFARLQSQDMGKVGAMQDLLRGVDKLLGKADKTTPQQTVIVQSENGANTVALLKRGNNALEDADWNGATEFFNRVLDMDADCAEAYLGLFLAEKCCSSLEVLDGSQEYDSNKNWIRAKKYAISETLTKIEQYELKHQDYLKKLEAARQERLQREKKHKELLAKEWEKNYEAEFEKSKARLKTEKLNLEKEYANLKGLFSGSHKKEIEARLAEIEVELQQAKQGLRFGSYAQNANGEKLPIEWLILEKSNGKLLLISKYGIDCKKYHETKVGVTWENCSLRKWLNETFLDQAFSAEQQKAILNTKVPATRNFKYSTTSGNETTDKLFLLSLDDVKKYFNSDLARKCAPTNYAIAHGAYTSESYTTGGKSTCWWWLRSSGRDQSEVASVLGDGAILYDGRSVNHENNCVRPAMWVTLDGFC